MAEHTEYAVQYKNLIGGPYDRFDDGSTWSIRFGRQFTREEAEKEVEWYAQRWHESDPEPPARLVSRVVTDWEPVIVEEPEADFVVLT